MITEDDIAEADRRDNEARDDELDAKHLPSDDRPFSFINRGKTADRRRAFGIGAFMGGGSSDGSDVEADEDSGILKSTDIVDEIKASMSLSGKRKNRYPGGGSGSDSDADSDFDIGSGTDSDAPRSSAKRARIDTGAVPIGLSGRPPERKARSLSEQIDILREQSRASVAAGGAPLPGFVGNAGPANPGAMNMGAAVLKAAAFDWANVEAAEPELNPGWCALCKFTPDDNPWVQDLTTYAERNWAHAEPEELGTTMQKMYNEQVRYHIEDETMRQPCHKQMFWRHFYSHCTNQIIQWIIIGQGVNEMITTMLEEQMFVANPITGRKNVTDSKTSISTFKLLINEKSKITKLQHYLKTTGTTL